MHISQTKTIANVGAAAHTLIRKKEGTIRKGGVSKGKMIRVTK